MNKPQTQNRGRSKPVIPPKSQTLALRPKRSKSPRGSDSTIMRAPVAIANRRRVQRPSIRQLGGRGDARVVHREYIQDIAGSVAFAAVALSINPGLASTFPWLSNIARNYESYRFRKLKFCYETESSTATIGTLMLVVDYDAADPAPTSKAQAMTYRSAVRSAPWAMCCHDSLLEDLSKLKSEFIRGGLNPAGTDIKTYDIGTLYICTQGESNTNNIGELYVEYDIELLTPQLNSNVGVGEALSGVWNNLAVASGTPSAGNSLPATLSNAPGTSNVSTWTFQQSWSGTVSYDFVGTTLANSGGITGTATLDTRGNVVNATDTVVLGYSFISAIPGQTVILTCPNATLTTAVATFNQGLFV